MDAGRLVSHMEYPIARGLMRDAAWIKAAYWLSYADTYAAGLTEVWAGALISSDCREFDHLGATSQTFVLWVLWVR